MVYVVIKILGIAVLAAAIMLLPPVFSQLRNDRALRRRLADGWGCIPGNGSRYSIMNGDIDPSA